MNINFNIRTSKFAFTLIEILVYIGVFALVAGVLYSFIIWVYHSDIKTRAMREVLDNGQRAMETMIYEIREARSIYTPLTTSTQLSLETTHYLPEGESFSYIDFFLCGAQICLKKETENPIPLTSDKVEVKELNFSQISATSSFPSVQINLKLVYKNPFEKPEYQVHIEATSTVSLRAY